MILATRGDEVQRGLIRDELRRRTSRPQRHRLLQGYPMAPLMRPVSGNYDPYRALELDPERPLIIGILPHTFCNPRVKGCGFCTFPHEKFGHEPMRQVLEQVEREIEQASLRQPALRTRRIEALYVGGGTANLTPPDDLERLCDLLASTFDLRTSELTLEGVPKYFLLRDEALLDVLARAAVRHGRISMGIQTFDASWLRRMGREAFGDRDDFERVVAAAHRRRLTVSADLLFNLPGASLEHALGDVRMAIEGGFDQICVYNLVLASELDTPWAQDQSLVNANARWLQSDRDLARCSADAPRARLRPDHAHELRARRRRADLTPLRLRAHELRSGDVRRDRVWPWGDLHVHRPRPPSRE
jgi:hypothetical protein